MESPPTFTAIDAVKLLNKWSSYFDITNVSGINLSKPLDGLKIAYAVASMKSMQMSTSAYFSLSLKVSLCLLHSRIHNGTLVQWFLAGMPWKFQFYHEIFLIQFYLKIVV